MAKKFTVNYQDGRTDEAALTMRAMCKAEEVMAKEGMVASRDSINATMHAIYADLRTKGKTSDPFETWLDAVDDIDTVEDETKTGDGDADPLD